MSRRVLMTALAMVGTVAVASSQEATAEARNQPILYVSAQAGAILAVDSRGREVARVPSEGHLLLLGWSPKGDWFAYCERDEAVHIRNLRGEDIVVFAPPEGVACGGWLSPWSPDGSRLALLSGTRPWPAELAQPTSARRGPGPVLQIVDVSSRTLRRTISLPDRVAMTDGLGGGPAGSTPYRVSWSRDNRHVLVCWLQAMVVDADSGQVVTEFLDNDPLIEWVGTGDAVFHIEGSRSTDIEATVGPVTLNRVAIHNGQRTTILPGHRAAEFGLYKTNRYPFLALSSSGRRLAMTGNNQEVLLIYDLAADGSFDPFKPAARYDLDFVLMAMDWAPGDDSIVSTVIVSDEESSYVRAEIRVLDMKYGTWTQVGVIGSGLGVGIVDALGFYKFVSWSQ